MEDLLELCAIRDVLRTKLEQVKNDALVKLSAVLRGNTNAIVDLDCAASDSATPQQSLKRIKRLSNVNEGDETAREITMNRARAKRTSNSSLLTLAESINDCVSNTSEVEEENKTLTQTTINAVDAIEMDVQEVEPSFARPMRQSKARAEKNLKEPQIRTKLRRPTNDEIPKIKQEKSILAIPEAAEKNDAEESVVVIANNVQTILEISAEDEETTVQEQTQKPEKQLRVMVKREKLSNEAKAAAENEEIKDNTETQTAAIIAEVKNERNANLQKNDTVAADATTSTMSSAVILEATTSSTATETQPQKKRGKKHLYKPIKVERFSDLDKQSKAVSTTALQDVNPTSLRRTRSATNKIINETYKKDEQPSDATFCTGVEPKQKNLVDETFDIPSAETNRSSLASSRQSMQTAKDTVSPVRGESLLTDDDDDDTEIIEPTPTQTWKNMQQMQTKPLTNKFITSATKKHELFNPLVQSPVKMKVKAFENAVKPNAEMEAANNARGKRTKENKPINVGNSNTPLAKHRSAVMERFLTPNQLTNKHLTPNPYLEAAKKPVSASKAMSVPKIGKIKPLNNTKPISRENSADEIRKLNEEKKRQREQKHLLAAQLRETKERERAERLAKAAKEREEKLLAKKQAEAELRKREQEELQRKAAEFEARRKAQKAKVIAEQEREMLQSLNEAPAAKAVNDMPPPPPPSRQKYCFEMLHEDDSTDDEEKITYKRPQPPSWSRRNNRLKPILMQQHLPTCIIDHLFSVRPTTLDLQAIFPDIDKRHLKRNSSALWSTPPRYSELPKY